MTDDLKQELKEYIFMGIQSGKKETSALVLDLKEKFLGAVREEIKVTVNGKLDGVKKHLENQDHLLNDIKDEQIRVKEELQKLKVDTDPLIDAKKVLLNFGKFVLWLGGIVIIIHAVINLFK